MAELISDGSTADVQAQIDLATDGDVVIIPAGSFNWTSGVLVSGKAIHIQGEGSGRVISRSASSVLVGTGLKSFTLTDSGLDITAGQTLRVERTGGVVSGGSITGALAIMEGSVVSYSGSSLVLNVTSTTGSGTHPLWIVSTNYTTKLTHNSSGGALFEALEHSSGSVKISGIYFAKGGAVNQNYINSYPISGGMPVHVFDCYAEMVDAADNDAFWRSFSPRGLAYRCSLIGKPMGNGNMPFVVNADSVDYDAWTSASTMGDDDTTGRTNFYIEDCDFHGLQNSMDLSNNGRVVVRYCTFNNAGVTTHGSDSAWYGLRHFEFYNNTFIWNGYADGQSLPVPYWLNIRGGTGVIYNNTIPDISSTDFPGTPEIQLNAQQLDRNGGPNPLWSDNDGGVVEYPIPRQVGMGYVTGAGLDGHGRSTDPNPGAGWIGTYVGDVEPIYIWGNTGSYAITLATSGLGQAIDPDEASGYIQAGRDYFDNETAKPGWTAFSYPHPDRDDAVGEYVENPEFTPIEGEYEGNQSIEITTATDGATIRYTIDGSDPTPENGIIYTTVIGVAEDTDIRAIAYKEGLYPSQVVLASYTITGPSEPSSFRFGRLTLDSLKLTR